MEAIRDKISNYAAETGFWSLCCTLFLLSFPRSWSLYPLGLMLFCGLIIWFADFNNVAGRFIRSWYIVLPPMLYFILHLISVSWQKAGISLLEGRLMFLLIPLLGLPVFFRENTFRRTSYALTIYIAGLALICLYQTGRILINIFTGYPGEVSFFDWMNQHDPSFFSLGFSIFEHPTYLALKLNWAIIVLIFFHGMTVLKKKYTIPVIILFCSALIFAASKAGLIILVTILMISLFRTLRKGIHSTVISAGLITIMIVFTIFLSLRINRIDMYFTEVKSRLVIENPDLKNIDQRTREWYSAFQIIKQQPLSGTGFAKAEEKLVEEYVKNGFNDEALLRLNAHNQFLEAQMTFGIAGTVTLFLMLFLPLFFRSRMISPQPVIALISLTICFLLIESMFNRQWGIMFFLLFINLLALKLKE
ncbi:MAG TPA: O-antigen ligase family protein [Bacteroidales bacterium]|nr:O-antigen ligase family protein [Bacteroidales bacterium]HPR11254.1 O-antigen ligase family protein [Bacteroidales bacterium]